MRYCDKCHLPAVWIRNKEHDANGFTREAVCDSHKEKVRYNPETGEALPSSNPNPWRVMVPATPAIQKEI